MSGKCFVIKIKENYRKTSGNCHFIHCSVMFSVSLKKVPTECSVLLIISKNILYMIIMIAALTFGRYKSKHFVIVQCATTL